MRFASVVLLGLLAGGAWAESLLLFDDRGKPITDGLEVCFQLGTESQCSTLTAGSTSELPSEFVALRVEGPAHGPVTVPKRLLKVAASGEISVVVPRKADLQIVARGQDKVTVSTYPVDDPTFRRPALRQTVAPRALFKIPAGDLLVSLSDAASAPDLHVLGALPGSSHRLTFRKRQGWSLVVRARAERDDSLQAGANVSVSGAEGFAAPGSRGATSVSGRSGLATISGIRHLLASATVEHPRFVPTREEGLSASPASFAFREIRLREGARLTAVVSEAGRPLAGALCQVLEYEANPLGPAPEPAMHAEAETDATGTCRASRLAPGSLTLRVKVPGSRSWLDREISLVGGEELTLDVSLASIRVYGTAMQGTQPAQGFRVVFLDWDNTKSNATERDAPAVATTDEEGNFEASLRAAGNYVVSLRTPSGTPAAAKRLWLGAAEERVDFSLEEYGIGGVVLDDKEQPVEGASLMLAWNGYSRVGHTDKKGTFLFPLSDAGEGRLQVSKPGFLAPAPLEISSQPGQPPPPLVLRLKRAGLLAGSVVARGPAAGASLRSYRLGPGGSMIFVGMARTDAGGHFEIPASEMGLTRIFVTGAGCPLASFDLPPTISEVTLSCPVQPASLALLFTDTKGEPVAAKTVFARRDGAVVPNEVLIEHLSGLHLPAASDSNGRLLLVALAPGAYDFFLTDLTNPELIAQGNPQGLLTSAQLDAFTTTEAQVTIDASP